MTKVMVLNDGETFTNVTGCKILVFDETRLNDSQRQSFESGYLPSNAEVEEVGGAIITMEG